MKYVMVQNQTVNISGTIAHINTIYNKTYDHEDIVVREDLLIFEHTNKRSWKSKIWFFTG